MSLIVCGENVLEHFTPRISRCAGCLAGCSCMNPDYFSTLSQFLVYMKSLFGFLIAKNCSVNQDIQIERNSCQFLFAFKHCNMFHLLYVLCCWITSVKLFTKSFITFESRMIYEFTLNFAMTYQITSWANPQHITPNRPINYGSRYFIR